MKNLFKNQIFKEIIISLAVIAAYRLLGKVPLPFVNISELNVLFSSSESRISILALGIMPFVSASVIIEICSLFIPFLKNHRGGDYLGRKVLQKYSLILTFFLSVLQGKFIIQGLEGILSPSGTHILMLSNNLQFIALLSTLVASVFLILFLAETATMHGVGNGISLLILSGSVSGVYGNISKYIGHASEIDLNLFYVIPFTLIIFFSFVFIPIYLLKSTYVIPLKHNSDESNSNFFMLNSCLSGMEPMGYSTTLLMLPATLLAFTRNFESIASFLHPGTFIYYFCSFILVLLFSYFFGWLFLHPKRRFEALKSWGWNVQETFQYPIDSLKQKFLIMNLPWSIFLFAAIILPNILIIRFNVPFYLGGSSLLIITFISLDIVSRLKFWRENVHEKIFKIAEFQDLHHATMIRNHLKSENIKFYLQGYYHRHLLFFFGPYIPINLMVPFFEKERAVAIINRYYGGLGIIVKEK